MVDFILLLRIKIAMVDNIQPYQSILESKLADSLTESLPRGTLRRVQGAVQFQGKATAVIGMRRAGKTTFLHQLRGEKLADGITQERLPYINFEDERLAGLTADQLSPLIESYYRRFPAFRRSATVFLCLDEIQNVPAGNVLSAGCSIPKKWKSVSPDLPPRCFPEK